MQKGIAAFSDQLPKVINPKAHAIADYATLGGFMVMTAVFWKRNRRAAIAAAACAAAEAANTMLTDSPGGLTSAVRFRTHGRIDVGLAAAASALPTFLGFGDDSEGKAFRMMGLGITVVGALTDFESRPRRIFRMRRSA